MIAETLLQIEKDILQVRQSLTTELLRIESGQFFIPLAQRQDFNNAIRGSRIELLRLNNCLKAIEKLKSGTKSELERIQEKLNEQFDFRDKHGE